MASVESVSSTTSSRILEAVKKFERWTYDGFAFYGLEFLCDENGSPLRTFPSEDLPLCDFDHVIHVKAEKGKVSEEDVTFFMEQLYDSSGVQCKLITRLENVKKGTVEYFIASRLHPLVFLLEMEERGLVVRMTEMKKGEDSVGKYVVVPLDGTEHVEATGTVKEALDEEEMSFWERMCPSFYWKYAQHLPFKIEYMRRKVYWRPEKDYCDFIKSRKRKFVHGEVLSTSIQRMAEDIGDDTDVTTLVDGVEEKEVIPYVRVAVAVESVFPLHEEEKRKSLWESMVKSLYIRSPHESIADYFGEKIALYFVWQDNLIFWLFFASILGIIVFMASVIADDMEIFRESVWLPIICSFSILWATLFDNFTRRYTRKWLFSWGTLDYAEREGNRRGFKPTQQKRFYVKKRAVDENVILERTPDAQVDYVNPILQNTRTLISFSVLALFILLVCVYLWLLFLWRLSMEEREVSVMYWLPGIINGLMIVIFDNVYAIVAEKLNEWENFRTKTQHENMLVYKVVMFTFVNNYLSMFFLAFVYRASLLELQIQLAMIMSTRMVVELLLNFVKPRLFAFVCGLNFYQHYLDEIVSDKDDSDMSEADRAFRSRVLHQASLTEYEGVRDEYTEKFVQYGYVVLFACAFPLAPVFAMVHGIVATRSDGHKLCKSVRRPVCEPTSGTGTWENVVSLMSYVAIFTNSMLLYLQWNGFDDSYGDNYSGSSKVFMFVFMEHLLFVLKFTLSVAIPDTPKKIARKTRIGNVLMDLVDDAAVKERTRAARAARGEKLNSILQKGFGFLKK